MKGLVLLHVLFIFVVAKGYDSCGPHGYTDKCGSACTIVPTCKNPKPPVTQVPICTKQCVYRCICDKGYVFDEENLACVKLADCPKPDEDCGFGKFNKCASPCNKVTCQDLPNPPKSENDTICADVCEARCECKSGYVLNKDGKCIKSDDCPRPDDRCGKGGYYNMCASACDSPPTCSNPKPPKRNPCQVCILLCVPRCTCFSGYLLNNGTCIKPKECPC